MITALIQFSQTLTEFQIPELNSLCELFEIQMEIMSQLPTEENPILIAKLPDFRSIELIGSRSMLIKAIYELWAEGNTLEQLIEKHQKIITKKTEQTISEKETWKMTIETIGHTIKQPMDVLNHFEFLDPKGKVKLNQPDVILSVIMIYKAKQELIQKPTKQIIKRMPLLKKVYFGKLLKTGQSHLYMEKYSLKKREYLGTTSMDTRLSFLMANQALCAPGKLIYDPFVGTGSFLCCCSAFGAYTLGTDIDARQFKGNTKYQLSQLFDLSTEEKQAKTRVGRRKKKEKENLIVGVNDEQIKRDLELLEQRKMMKRKEWPDKLKQLNQSKETGIRQLLQQYQLSHLVLDTVQADFSNLPFRTNFEFLDAIVTDPPYGVRAGAKKISSLLETNPNPNPELGTNGRFPKMEIYEMSQLVNDLLEFAVKSLKPKGRLVFWLPTITEEFSVEDLPKHPRLKMISQSSQQFGKWERKLITMEKLENDCDAFILKEKRETGHTNFRVKYFTRK